MKFSKFGEKFSQRSGITSLMEDLNHGLMSDQDIVMMGGGNPSHIPAVQTIFHQHLQAIVNDPVKFKHLIGVYDAPQGDMAFIRSLAKLLKQHFGWPISDKNIALCNGSQSAFFILFNMFAGEYNNGNNKKILLPLCPEYIGYGDIGLTADFFATNRPLLKDCEEYQFKYAIDFDNLTINNDIGAICVSRPTNPSGNVITDAELARLSQLARENDIPLIVDSAYGSPFPDIIFTPVNPIWDSHLVISMSLSKLGLPTSRTGILIAHEEIITKVAEANAVLSLSTGSFGSMITQELIDNGEIIRISRELIKPFYQEKAEQALALIRKLFSNKQCKCHKPEGAMFLWLWFEGLPISNHTLYQRLKDRGVYVVSGHHFFPGFNDNWRHQHECIRVTYTQDKAVIERGLKIIADEVNKAYAEG